MSILTGNFGGKNYKKIIKNNKKFWRENLLIFFFSLGSMTSRESFYTVLPKDVFAPIKTNEYDDDTVSSPPPLQVKFLEYSKKIC